MSVDVYGPFREDMEPLWEQARTLLGGTAEMRKAGQTYLPIFENETTKNYQRRLSLASLTNFYAKARNQMIGEIFREDIQYKDGALPEDIIDNIDQRGTDLQGMAEKIADGLLTRSCCGIVVDHPKNDGGLSLADELRLGIRHYWTFIRAENLIDLVCTYINGKETIVQVRWYEDHIVDGKDEFSFKAERRIVVLDRQLIKNEDGGVSLGSPRGRIYKGGERPREDDLTTKEGTTILHVGGGVYEPMGEWQDLSGFSEIPFVPFQVNRESIWKGRPPLADIAEKNIQHWRQSSNYGNALEIGAFPILVRYGLRRTTPTSPLEGESPISDDGESIIGPHIIMDVPSTLEGAKAEYLEPSGRAYEALERSLDRIIHEAELMALNLLIKESQKSATEATYDRLQALAPLQRVAMEIERGMNRALAITAEARGRNEQPGFVEINKDFGVSASDVIRVQALKDARAIGDITAETYLNELKAIGALSAYLDVDAEVQNAQAAGSLPPPTTLPPEGLNVG